MHLVPATIVSFLLKAKNGLLAVRGVSVHGEGEEWWWMVEIRSLNVADSLFFFCFPSYYQLGTRCVFKSVLPIWLSMVARLICSGWNLYFLLRLSLVQSCGGAIRSLFFAAGQWVSSTMRQVCLIFQSNVG